MTSARQATVFVSNSRTSSHPSPNPVHMLARRWGVRLTSRGVFVRTQKVVDEVREITEEEIDTFDQMWALWDVDHSGELDKEELRVVRPPTPHTSPLPPAYERAVAACWWDMDMVRGLT